MKRLRKQLLYRILGESFNKLSAAERRMKGIMPDDCETDLQPEKRGAIR